MSKNEYFMGIFAFGEQKQCHLWRKFHWWYLKNHSMDLMGPTLFFISNSSLQHI